MTDVYVTTGKEWERVVRELRDVADKGLRNDIRKKLKTIVKPIVAEVKANIKAMPIKGARGGTTQHPRRKGSRKIRNTIARGVGVRMALAKRPTLRIVTKVPETDLAMLPRGLDKSKASTRDGFRHPVYGQFNEQWVDQHGRPWFRDPIAEKKPAVQKQVMEAMQEATARIARKGT